MSVLQNYMILFNCVYKYVCVYVNMFVHVFVVVFVTKPAIGKPICGLLLL